MRFDTFVFDLDGTLVDSYAALTNALNSTAREHGFREHDVDEVRALVGEGIERFLERAFGRVDPALLETFESHYDRVCENETSILPNVAAVLRILHVKGHRIGVCTNKSTRFANRILQRLGLLRYITVVAGPDLAGARKPDPRHLLFTLRELGAAVEGALFIGDMPIDVETARRARCHVAVIASGSSSREELKTSDPDFMLESFEELLTIADSEVSV